MTCHRWKLCGVLAIGSVLLAGCHFFGSKKESDKESTAAALATDQQKYSYAIGFNFGRNLKSQGVSADAEALLLGVKEGALGTTQSLSDQEQGVALRKLQSELVEKRTQARGAEAEKNKQAGEAFRTAFKAKEGVTTTASGLMYRVVETGKGKKPKSSDKVQVNYVSKHADGTEYETSKHQGGPVEVALNDTLPGWREALMAMPVGAHWELVLPPELAYGEQGKAPSVGPFETLVFDLELVSIGGKP